MVAGRPRGAVAISRGETSRRIGGANALLRALVAEARRVRGRIPARQGRPAVRAGIRGHHGRRPDPPHNHTVGERQKRRPRRPRQIRGPRVQGSRAPVPALRARPRCCPALTRRPRAGAQGKPLQNRELVPVAGWRGARARGGPARGSLRPLPARRARRGPALPAMLPPGASADRPGRSRARGRRARGGVDLRPNRNHA